MWGSGEATEEATDWGATDTGTSSGFGEENKRTPRKKERGDKRSSGGWDDDGAADEDGQQRKKPRQDADGEERKESYKPEELDLEEEAKLQAEGAGENFERYNDQKVTCFPDGLITAVEKFEDVVASKLLLDNIKSQKFSDMTPIQKWAMPTIMAGYDLIGCAQTGSGKTAAFLLPILQNLLNSDLEPSDPNSDCQNPYCLIISPTRELANQIFAHTKLLSKDSIIQTVVIYGQVATCHLKANLSKGCHILVATLGRLKDFVNRGWIGFSNIKYIVLDEGDRLVDDGFSSDLESIFNHSTMPSKEKRQTLFFSATFKDETQLQAKKYLKETFVFLAVGRIGAANLDIKQEFMQVRRDEKKRELKKILNQIPEEDKCIIFTQTKTCADMLAGFFTALNLSSTSIHGDRLQSQREQAIKAFRRGEKRFLISSPVGNRGLDLPKVSLVINYDLPSCIDEYVHRIGRTGRAGHTGRALSFYDADRDSELVPHLIEILSEAKQEIPDWLTSGGDSNGNTEEAPQDDWDNGGSGGATKTDAAAADDSWDAPPKKKAAPAAIQGGLEEPTDDSWDVVPKKKITPAAEQKRSNDPVDDSWDATPKKKGASGGNQGGSKEPVSDSWDAAPKKTVPPKNNQGGWAGSAETADDSWDSRPKKRSEASMTNDSRTSSSKPAEDSWDSAPKKKVTAASKPIENTWETSEDSWDTRPKKSKPAQPTDDSGW